MHSSYLASALLVNDRKHGKHMKNLPRSIFLLFAGVSAIGGLGLAALTCGNLYDARAALALFAALNAGMHLWCARKEARRSAAVFPVSLNRVKYPKS